jgi:hypothetical protein
MGHAIPQILLICCLMIPALAEDFNPEEDDIALLVILDDKPPITDPVHMPEAAQIIVQFSSDLSEIGISDINWTAFYAGFPELNHSENITMLRA